MTRMTYFLKIIDEDIEIVNLAAMVLSKLVGWYTHHCFLAYSF